MEQIDWISDCYEEKETNFGAIHIKKGKEKVVR